jgi:hypothetical protein
MESTQRPIQLALASPGVKLLDRESDHSPPSSAEIRKGGAVPPLICIHIMMLS